MRFVFSVQVLLEALFTHVSRIVSRARFSRFDLSLAWYLFVCLSIMNQESDKNRFGIKINGRAMFGGVFQTTFTPWELSKSPNGKSVKYDLGHT